MVIQSIEDAIIARLKSQLSALQIQGFSLKAVEFAMKHPVGAILVNYQGSKYNTIKTANRVYQERWLSFAIFLLIKNLRIQDGAPAGAYDYIDTILTALTGYKIANCSKICPVTDEFKDEDAGLWQYGLLIKLRTQNNEAV